MSKRRPFATLVLIILCLAITIIAPIFDSSIYGVNGHPTLWLSFMPNHPLRNFGSSVILSPFIHLNFQHLITNLVLLTPISLMVERKTSARLLYGLFAAIHLMVICGLLFSALFFDLNDKGFLGASHIVIGLYAFWAALNKKWGLLLIPFLMIALGLWQAQGQLTILAHTLGLAMGLKLIILHNLWRKLRSHTSN